MATKEQNNQQSIGSQLMRVKNEMELTRQDFNKLNLVGLSFDKEMEFACQKFEENPFLLKCSVDSVKACLVNIALSGLSLNPILKYSYLVPRKVKDVYKCMVDPSYMGLCKILTDTGSVVAISATVVYEKEIASLKIKQGVNGYATYQQYFGREKPGSPIACFSEAKLPDGTVHVELLRVWEWEGIKNRSESVKSYNNKLKKGEYAPIPTWITDEEEMIRKTCIKKHYKYLPKTLKAEQIAKVIDMDNQANGIEFENQNTQPTQQAKSPVTPNAPFSEALATEEDFNKLMDLLDDPSLGDILVIGSKQINKDGMKKAITNHYAAGTLEKSKAEGYIKALEKLIEASQKDSEDGEEELKGGFA